LPEGGHRFYLLCTSPSPVVPTSAHPKATPAQPSQVGSSPAAQPGPVRSAHREAASEHHQDGLPTAPNCPLESQHKQMCERKHCYPTLPPIANNNIRTDTHCNQVSPSQGFSPGQPIPTQPTPTLQPSPAQAQLANSLVGAPPGPTEFLGPWGFPRFSRHSLGPGNFSHGETSQCPGEFPRAWVNPQQGNSEIPGDSQTLVKNHAVWEGTRQQWRERWRVETTNKYLHDPHPQACTSDGQRILPSAHICTNPSLPLYVHIGSPRAKALKYACVGSRVFAHTHARMRARVCVVLCVLRCVVL
jgi:hypothetical protein